MTLPTPTERPRRRPDVYLRQAGEENAIYDPASGSLHFLNNTAMAIWHLCDGETYPHEMVEAVCDLCAMHRDVVEEDLGRILGDFARTNLITWVR